VALAKVGDLAGALPCYDQALQLDASNADALVARGAALANQRQWQRASGAFNDACCVLRVLFPAVVPCLPMNGQGQLLPQPPGRLLL